MIIGNGTVRFGAGKLDGRKAALAGNIVATRAEPGCLRYDYGVDVGDADLLSVSEQWESETAIDAHMRAPHMAEMMAAIGGAIEAAGIKAYDARCIRDLPGE